MASQARPGQVRSIPSSAFPFIYFTLNTLPLNVVDLIASLLSRLTVRLSHKNEYTLHSIPYT